jgi:hypothetical protein
MENAKRRHVKAQATVVDIARSYLQVSDAVRIRACVRDSGSASPNGRAYSWRIARRIFQMIASETEKWGNDVRFSGATVEQAKRLSSRIRHFGYCIICPIFSATA